MLKQSAVIFLEDTHQYFKTTTGEELSGITGMINRQLFPDKYSAVDKATLHRKALRGKEIHSDCQSYDMFGLDGTESPEVLAYAALMQKDEIENISNEYIVTDDRAFATPIDKVFRYKDTQPKRVNLGDIKTTAKLDEEYLSWQLSVGAVLFEMQNPDLKVASLYGIWLKGDKAKMILVPRKADGEVFRLIDCEIKGEQFVPKGDVLQAEVTNKFHSREDIEKIAIEQQSVLQDAEFQSEELEGLIVSTGIDTDNSVLIRNSFENFLFQTEAWNERAKQIVVTDSSQTGLMKSAKEARLMLRTIRTDADKKRKSLKESSLKYSNAVQGAYNLIEGKIKPIEQYLELQETFAERQIADAKEALRKEREEAISEVREFIPFTIDLSSLPKEEFDLLKSGALLQKEAKQKADKEAQAEAQKLEEEKEAERLRLVAENTALRTKQEIAEKQLAEEQKTKDEAARLLAEKQSAPDKVKLADLAKAFKDYELPQCTTAEGKAIIENTRVLLNKVTDYITLKIK